VSSSLSGGTNLPLEFLTQIDVNSGGYQAEFGGAMGGVINMVLKSGSTNGTARCSATTRPTGCLERRI